MINCTNNVYITLQEPLDSISSTTYEQQYDRLMIEMRQQNLLSFSADSKMPFALKQRRIELPMLEHSVSLAMSSPKWRQVVVQALLENIENGPGHLSVHRAKDALKRIASFIGLIRLTSMIDSQNAVESNQAAHLLGWLKNPRAARTLIIAMDQNHALRQTIEDVLSQHYNLYKVDKP